MSFKAIILGSSLAFSFLCATDMSQINEFYYKKGYNDAKDQYYKQGYRDAIRDVIKVLRKYGSKMEATEASKYLMRSGKITYPQVFRVQKPDGSMEIVITKPRIEDKLTISELASIPLYGNYSLVDVNIENNSNAAQSANNPAATNPNSFYLQNQEVLINDDLKKVKDINKQVEVCFPKTAKAKSILEKSGLPYVETADSYQVYFKNLREKISFCKNIGGGLCR